jgi:hypothetical protein
MSISRQFINMIVLLFVLVLLSFTTTCLATTDGTDNDHSAEQLTIINGKIFGNGAIKNKNHVGLFPPLEEETSRQQNSIIIKWVSQPVDHFQSAKGSKFPNWSQVLVLTV